MCSVYSDGVFLRRVPPFGYLRINAHLQLPEAFRSLSRPSSAPDAKAFPLRSFLLDLSSVAWFSNYAGSLQFFAKLFILPVAFHNQVFSNLPLCCLACLLSLRYSVLKVLPWSLIRNQISVLSLQRTLKSALYLFPSLWWAQVDSNHRPHDYQSCALTS